MPKRKSKRQKEYEKRLCICIVMSIIVLSLGFFLKQTSLLEPKVDEITTSFISFNNNYTTDMLRINNIVVMSDRIGSSDWNPHSVQFEITGEEEQEVEVVLYPLTNTIDEEYIEVGTLMKKELTRYTLERLDSTEDGGKILYKGKVQKEEMTVYLWISKSYKGKKEENSFEIKVRPR